MNPNPDIVIIGGGVIGSSVAYHLMRADRTLNVVVVERDPTYEQASSTLSLANVRIQFSLKENVAISRYAVEVLKQFDTEMTVDGDGPYIAFKQEGNLFMVAPTDRSAATRTYDLQKRLGCAVEWWLPADIVDRYPLFRPDGYAAGTFGPEDGHFDAHAVLHGYRKKARALGAVYLTDTVVSVNRSDSRVAGVALASGAVATAPVVINCAGAWAAEIAQSAGVILPVRPVRRQVFAIDTAVKPAEPLPLTVLPSGLYFRSETGDLLLVGKSMSEDPVGIDFSWDDKRFTDILWPELAGFVPAFDRARLIRGWAGLYAVNALDGNAILGEWPTLEGFFLANGFSGHGLQQAPAVGRYLAERVLGRPPELDLSIFSPQRIIENRPVAEGGLV